MWWKGRFDDTIMSILTKRGGGGVVRPDICTWWYIIEWLVSVVKEEKTNILRKREKEVGR